MDYKCDGIVVCIVGVHHVSGTADWNLMVVLY